MTGCLALLLILAPPELPADLERLVLAAPRAEDLPQFGAVYLRHEREFEIDAAGRVTVILRQTIKVLQESGRRYRIIDLPWVTPWQTVSLPVARTVLADGKLVDVTDLAIESLPPGRFGERVGELTRYRLNFPYVEPGAVVDYEVHITDTRPSQPGLFADEFRPQQAEPVELARYVVRTPPATVFDQAATGPLPPPAVSRRDALTETTWTVRGLPGLVAEPQRPDDSRLGLRLVVTSARSWAEVVDRYRQAARPHYAATQAIRDEVQRVTAGAADPVRAIHEAVATRVRYAFGSFERGLPGIEPRPAYETFRLRMGDCKDQATLLITMLDVAGRRAWPALVRRGDGGPLLDSVPALLQFDHVLVAVPEGGRVRWLDPTWSYGSPDWLPGDLQGARALIVQPDAAAWATLPSWPAAANSLERHGDLAITAEGGLQGTVNTTASGAFEQSLRYRFRGLAHDAVARDVALALNAALANVRFDHAALRLSPVEDLDAPFVLGYRLEAPSYALRTQQLLLVQLAVFDRAEVPAGLTVAERRWPLRLAAAPERTVNALRFAIPAGLTVREVPPDRARSETFGSFRVTYRLRGGTLDYAREVVLQRAEVAAAETALVRSWYEDLVQADQQLLVLEKR